MSLSRFAPIALAVGALALVGVGSAGADTQRHANLKPDGAVWLVRADGHVCKIYASRNLTPATCLNANLVRVENRGFTSGVDGLVYARLYYDQSWQNGGRSAYACISPQDVWQRSAGGTIVNFDHVATHHRAGTGLFTPIWHNVARVQWSRTPCSVYPK